MNFAEWDASLSASLRRGFPLAVIRGVLQAPKQERPVSCEQVVKQDVGAKGNQYGKHDFLVIRPNTG